MVVVMNRDRPQALLVDLERLGVPDLPAVRVALAVSLFRSGAVSAGFAARVTGCRNLLREPTRCHRRCGALDCPGPH